MSPLPETVYTPQSAIQDPQRLIRSMLHDLVASKDLAWRLFLRNIRSQYRQTMLGYIWAFLPPLAITFAFVFLNSQGILTIGSTSMPYPLFVVIGTVLWQSFTDALNAPLRIVESSTVMLARINFPREALLLAAAGEVLFNFLVRLILLGGVLIYFQIEPHTSMLLAPLGVFILIWFGFTLGIFLVPFGLLYRDIGQGLGIVTLFWMFLTPVVYPTLSSGPLAPLIAMNPVASILNLTRDWLAAGIFYFPPTFWILPAATFILFVFGLLLFRLSMPHLIARMGG
jgi:lipopolysaccharide transport system permease protein